MRAAFLLVFLVVYLLNLEGNIDGDGASRPGRTSKAGGAAFTQWAELEADDTICG